MIAGTYALSGILLTITGYLFYLGVLTAAEMDILTVLAPGHEPDAAEADQLGALRRLGSLLGAHVVIEQGDDVSEVVARVAEERRSTYVLMGTPAPRTGFKRFSEPLTERLLRRLPGVDLRVVADRSKRRRTPR